MESEQEQDPPLHPKSHPLSAEAVLGDAAHGSVLVGGTFDTVDGAYGDHSMQIAAS